MPITPLPVQVTNNAAAGRYEATFNGEVAGFAVYEELPGTVVFTHMEVDTRWGGRGVGGALARGALDQVVAEGKSITPLCSFMASYIRRHRGYVAHVAEERRGEFDL